MQENDSDGQGGDGPLAREIVGASGRGESRRAESRDQNELMVGLRKRDYQDYFEGQNLVE